MPAANLLLRYVGIAVADLLGGCGIFCLWASFYAGSLALDALMFWACAAGLLVVARL